MKGEMIQGRLKTFKPIPERIVAGKTIEAHYEVTLTVPNTDDMTLKLGRLSREGCQLDLLMEPMQGELELEEDAA